MSIWGVGLTAAPPAADDWPCWRGPTHDGQAAAGQRVPQTWGDAANVVWSVDVPGRGNGSPTVVGNRVYLATCDEATGSQSVLAYERATGKLVWQRQVHAEGAMRKNEKSTGASTTTASRSARRASTQLASERNPISGVSSEACRTGSGTEPPEASSPS